jgi:hypothetical protein
MLCRSKDPIMHLDDPEASRLCRVVAIIPEHLRRNSAVPEYKVTLLARPVSAFRRHHELTPLP